MFETVSNKLLNSVDNTCKKNKQFPSAQSILNLPEGLKAETKIIKLVSSTPLPFDNDAFTGYRTTSASPVKTKKHGFSKFAATDVSVRMKTIVKNLQYLWPPDSNSFEKNNLGERDEFKFLKKSLFNASKMLKGI